ncbi:MAG: hypothetical protein Q8R60_00005, partial [Mycobacteriales bacterium]|nr:hypothetical protein [Mycobacteriales bacterium]
MRRALVATLVAAACALVAVPAALPASSAATCVGRTTERGGVSGVWWTYALPRFSVGPAAVVAHAGDAAKWFVTNGVEVVASTDTGCTWSSVLVLPETPTAELPYSRQTDRVRGLSAASGAVAATVEVLSEADPLGPLAPEGSPTRGLVSTTAVLWGELAPARTSPLTLPLGVPGPLAVAPSASGTVYAVAGGRLHRTSDSGVSWALTTPLPEPGAAVTAVAVHPKAPQVVYAVQGDAVHASQDSGATWTLLLDADGALVPAIAVTVDENNPINVRLLEQVDARSSPHQLRYSKDGSSFDVRPLGAGGRGVVEGPVQSGAGGARLDQFVVTTATDVYSYDVLGDRLVAVDEFDLGPLLDVDLSGSSFVFRGETRLARWIPGARLATLPRRLSVGPVGTPLPPLSPETVLSGPTEVALARDETATLDLDLDLSPEPTPIDVFFLLDTSGSMDDVVNGLVNGFAQLARELGEKRIDAQFGLGEYQDTAGTRYHRRLDISPPGEPLRKALATVSTAGGAEPAWTALHQMSTGTGILKPANGDPVPRGEGASWRQGSLRVVVHATDELPSDDPDGATRDEAVRAMRDDGVRHVGIEVVRQRSVTQVADDPTPTLDPGRLNRELGAVARATGALAPAGGVDCDGDGTVELAAGAPLVCQVVPNGDVGPVDVGVPETGDGTIELASPLLRILATLRDEQPVGVEVSPPAAAADLRATVRSLSAATTVNVKESAALAYSVSVTCAPAAYGGTFDLSLLPRVGARRGSALPLRVTCEPLPGGPVPPGVEAPGAPQPRPVAAALPAPPIPPPVP